MIKYFVVLWLFLTSTFCWSEMLVTYRNTGSINDARLNYEIKLLELALQKTVDTHGDYQLKASTAMNIARSLNSIETNAFENLFVLSSYKPRYNDTLSYIPFPLQRGIVGYRVFLTTQEGQSKLNAINSLEQLKKLKVIQKEGWQDINILETNGFEVTTLSSYESLFQVLSHNRADVLPRSISEYEFELGYYKEQTPNLILDEKLALYYPFPRFFYTNRKNRAACERIHEGLKRAWEDGSFIALWKQYHEEEINKANLSKRLILKLNNPDMKYLPEDISQYFYHAK